MQPENELIHRLTYEEYDAEEGVRASELSNFIRSPQHYWFEKNNIVEPTPALIFGKIFHEAIEFPNEFLAKYAQSPDVKLNTKVGKDEYNSWLSTLTPQQIPLRHEEYRNIRGMLNSCYDDEFVKELLKSGTRESSLFTVDRVTGLKKKCRLDFITVDGEPVDFKTTTDASDRATTSDILNYGYDMQGAHYDSCLLDSGLGNPQCFTFVFVEKTEPWALNVRTIDHTILYPTEKKRIELMKRLKGCMAENKYPGYNRGASIVVPPQWYVSQNADVGSDAWPEELSNVE